MAVVFSVLMTSSPVSPSVLGLMVFHDESSKSGAYSGSSRGRFGTSASFQRQSFTAMARVGRLGMNVSGSWQLGSPLPTPRIFPAPSTTKLILFCANGTARPCASAAETVNTATSSPSALMFWTAPAERSGDGALASDEKRGRASLAPAVQDD